MGSQSWTLISVGNSALRAGDGAAMPRRRRRGRKRCRTEAKNVEGILRGQNKVPTAEVHDSIACVVANRVQTQHIIKSHRATVGALRKQRKVGVFGVF